MWVYPASAKRDDADMNKAWVVSSILAAGVMWGCMSLFIRMLSDIGFSAFEIALGRMSAAVVVLFFILLIKDKSLLRIRPRDIVLFACMGAGVVMCYNYLYTLCVSLCDVSIAVVLFDTSPVFVVIMGAIIYKEKINGRKIIALLLAFTGCVLVSGVLGGHAVPAPAAIAAGLASGFFYGLYSILARKAAQRYHALTITFYTFLFCSIACLFVVDPRSMMDLVRANSGIGPFLACVVACTIGPYLCYNWGLQHMEAGKAAILATIEVLVGCALGIIVYSEPVSAAKILGMLLIPAAVVLLNTGPADQPASEQEQ